MSFAPMQLMNSEARGIALSGALTTTAKGSEAISYNPACLEEHQISTGYINPYFGMGFNIANIAYASKYFGFKISYLNTGIMEETDNYGNIIGSFSSHKYSISASGKINIKDKTSIGFTASMLSQIAKEYKSYHFPIDIGILHTINKFKEEIKLAAVIKNIDFVKSSDLPSINLGVSLHPSKVVALLLKAGYQIRSTPDIGLGIELSLLKDYLKLRGGVSSKPSLTFGIGTSRKNFSFDLAVDSNGVITGLPTLMACTMSWKLGGKK